MDILIISPYYGLFTLSKMCKSWLAGLVSLHDIASIILNMMVHSIYRVTSPAGHAVLTNGK